MDRPAASETDHMIWSVSLAASNLNEVQDADVISIWKPDTSVKSADPQLLQDYISGLHPRIIPESHSGEYPKHIPVFDDPQ